LYVLFVDVLYLPKLETFDNAFNVVGYQNSSAEETNFTMELQNASITGELEDHNPYVLKGDGWIPVHVVVANREVYTIVCIVMTLVTIISIFVNSTVILTTAKFKVSFNCF